MHELITPSPDCTNSCPRNSVEQLHLYLSSARHNLRYQVHFEHHYFYIKAQVPNRFTHLRKHFYKNNYLSKA